MGLILTGKSDRLFPPLGGSEDPVTPHVWGHLHQSLDARHRGFHVLGRAVLSEGPIVLPSLYEAKVGWIVWVFQ